MPIDKPSIMIENASEQFKVAEKIKSQFIDTFDVLINIDNEEHFIGSIFPDIIFLDKTSKKPLFILEIKKNGRISTCLNQWKSQPSIPATLYLVVPANELNNAKSIAAVTGVNARFAHYTINGEEVSITFE